MHTCTHASTYTIAIIQGLLRELNPGPLAPEARIIPLDQAASWRESVAIICCGCVAAASRRSVNSKRQHVPHSHPSQSDAEGILTTSISCAIMAAVAQLVARRSHNPKVVSSILTCRIFGMCMSDSAWYLRQEWSLLGRASACGKNPLDFESISL